MALETGTQLGPYEIVTQIGAGGMGEVYRARDQRLGRDVAVKVLPPDLAADAERLRRFEQEARSVGALSHPNILSVFDLGESDGVRYIVTELLDGETLRQRAGGTAIPVRKAVDYATQIAEGLAAAGAAGIVHRDLKPENIFVTRDGRLKILDFGLAKQAVPRIDEATQTVGIEGPTSTTPGTVLGTVAYLSPEQVRGEPADHRSDIFALGTILYEMLTGQRPFRAATPVETMTAILRAEPAEMTRSAPDLSPGLERVVRRCLEKSPDERFQSARDLAFNLGELSTFSSGGIRSVAEEVSKPRNRWKLATVGALVAVALVVGYLVGSQNTPATGEIGYRQLTFRRGTITGARFSPDGNGVYYSAIWENEPSEVFTTSPDNPESKALGLQGAGLLGMSSTGELAVALDFELADNFEREGTLAHLPLATSTAPREVFESVRWADWSPDGAEFALVRRENGTSRLEYPAGTVLHETDGWISHPRISPDGEKVAFIHHPYIGDDRGSVGVVDRSGTVREIGPNWSTAWGLAWNPNGKEVWVTAGPDASLTVRRLNGITLDGASRVLAVGPGEMTLHDVSSAGDVLLSVEDRRRNLVGLPPGAEQERSLTWLDRTVANDLSADGSLLLFHEGGKAGGARGSVYLRRLDGSPAVRLADGYSIGFAADEEAVLAFLPKTPREYFLVPTGAGSPRRIDLSPWTAGTAFPITRLADGRVVVRVREPDKPTVLHALDLETKTHEPITPPDVNPVFVSRDGRFVVVNDAEGWSILPIDGKALRPIRGIEDGEFPIGLTADGAGVYVQRPEGHSAVISRLDADTGARETMHTLTPPNLSGSAGVGIVLLSADGRHYVYGYTQQLSELYLVTGVR